MKKRPLRTTDHGPSGERRKRKPHTPKSKRQSFNSKLTREEARLLLPELIRWMNVLIDRYLPEASAVFAPTTPFKIPLGVETLEQTQQPEESSPRPSRPTSQSRSTKKKRKNPAW